MLRQATVALIVLILFSNLSNGQFRKDKLITPTLKLSYQWQPQSDFEFVDNTWQYSTLGLNYLQPLITNMTKSGKAGSFGYRALMLSTGIEYSYPIINDLDVQHKLIDAGFGLSFIWYGGGRSVFTGAGFANIFEDNKSIKDSPQLRYSGFLNWHFKIWDWFGTNIGAAYTYKFGYARIVPLFGGNFNFDKFSMRISLPLIVQAGYAVSKRTSVFIKTMPDGAVNNFYNDGYEFPGQPEIIQLRQRKLLLGLGVDVFATRHMHLTPEIGSMSKQVLAFSDAPIDDPTNFYDEKIMSTVYLKLTAKFVFGEPAQWGKGHATNYLLDKNIEDALQFNQ